MVTVITIQELLEHTSKEAIKASTYKIGGKFSIRLFNSKEWCSSIPSLFPSTKAYKQLLKADNIMALRHDYLNGKALANRKTDLVISNPIQELPLIDLSINLFS